ncbi:MAG: hypothetical protein P8Z37_19595 [Acidobacteriota bacterium]
MKDKKRNGFQPSSCEDQYVESIVDILDKEMAAAGAKPIPNSSSGEMELLVEDLLDYLEIVD